MLQLVTLSRIVYCLLLKGNFCCPKNEGRNIFLLYNWNKKFDQKVETYFLTKQFNAHENSISIL